MAESNKTINNKQKIRTKKEGNFVLERKPVFIIRNETKKKKNFCSFTVRESANVCSRFIWNFSFSLLCIITHMRREKKLLKIRWKEFLWCGNRFIIRRRKKNYHIDHIELFPSALLVKYPWEIERWKREQEIHSHTAKKKTRLKNRLLPYTILYFYHRC